MKLTILGSGTCVPSLKRGSAGNLLQTDEANILIDIGLGSIHKLLKLDITYEDIDMIILTHTHADHMCELIPFIFACKFSYPPRERDLILVGGKGIEKFFSNLQSVFGNWLKPERFKLILKEDNNFNFPYKDILIESCKTIHAKESIGIKITDKSGKSITFSGDTEYSEDLIKLAKDTDLFVLECALPDNMKLPGHLTPKLSGKMAFEANPKKLILTHFYPPCEDVDILSISKDYFIGETCIAEDLNSYTI